MSKYYVFATGIRMGNRVDRQVALIEALDLMEAEAYLTDEFLVENGWSVAREFTKYTGALQFAHSKAVYRGHISAFIVVEGFRDCKAVKNDIYNYNLR